jgi:RNA polymerase-binding transcription factor DksA
MAFYVDELDRAQELAEAERAHGELMARQAAARIPAGNAGECDLCGEWAGRLVHGVCAPCRDLHRLP